MEAGPSQQDATNPSSRVKRKRVTLACQRCRAKKAKCNGFKPTCSNCEAADEFCQWPDPEKDGRKNKSRRIASEASAERAKESPLDGSISVLQNGQVSGPLYDWQCPLGNSIQRFYDAHQSACDPVVSEDARNHISPSIPSPGSNHRLHSPTNHLAPRVTSIQQSPPADSSPIDILLAAAALPTDPRRAQNLSEPENSGESSASSCIAESPRRLSYHRSLGPTAVEPALEKIRIHLNDLRPKSDQDSKNPVSSQCDGSHFLAAFTFEPNWDASRDSQDRRQNAECLSPQDFLYAPGSDVPRLQHLQKLVPLFFSRMGCHFPFMTEKSLFSPIDDDPSKRMTGPLLVNAVCALAARFSDSLLLKTMTRNERPATYGVPFADKAKHLLIPLLGYPSPNTVAALLFLAYFSFGLNDNGATWMYSGMALRMAVDLGLHQETHSEPASAADEIDRARNRLLWWSCFVLDRTVAFLTGKPATLRGEEINVALPNDADIIAVTSGGSQNSSPVKASTEAPISQHGKDPAFPFVHYVKMFQLYGLLAEIVNAPKSCSHPSNRGLSVTSEPTDDSLRRLAELEQSITASYMSLPNDMTFNPVNLKIHATSSGPVFLALHLWYNAIIILLYRVPLIHTHVIAARGSLTDRLSVVNHSSLAIYNILDSANLVDPSILLALPFVSHCFFIAAVASIQDCRIREGKSLASISNTRTEGANNSKFLHSSTGALGQMSMNNYKLCKSALSQQVPYWLGIQQMETVVEQYASQKRRLNVNGDVESVDIFMFKREIVSVGRLLQRLTGTSVQAEVPWHILDQLFAAADANERDPTLHTLSEDDQAFAYCLASFRAAKDDRDSMTLLND